MFVCVGRFMAERVGDPGCCLKRQYWWDLCCIDDSAKAKCCLAPAAIELF